MSPDGTPPSSAQVAAATQPQDIVLPSTDHPLTTTDHDASTDTRLASSSAGKSKRADQGEVETEKEEGPPRPPWWLAGPPWPKTYIYVTPSYRLAYPAAPSPTISTIPPFTPTGPFPLLRLPSELRLLIYTHYLLPHGAGHTIDLDPTNSRHLAPRLALLRTCRQIYSEALPIFYSRQAFRLFPTHPLLINSRKPLLARLQPRVRAALTCLELRVGPGWSAPPRGWVVRPPGREALLGLADCTALRTLKVFAECDPSHEAFRGWRVDVGFYTDFCAALVRELFAAVPSIREVEFDAWSSVQREGPLIGALVELARRRSMRVLWGPERGWAREGTVEALEDAMEAMML